VRFLLGRGTFGIGLALLLLPLGACLPAGAESLWLALVDRSASMGRPAAAEDNVRGPSRLEAAGAALDRLLADPEAAGRWGLMAFAETPRLLLPLGSGRRELQASLAALKPGGKSRLAAALNEASALLAAAPGDGRRVLLLISDCLNSASPAEPLPQLSNPGGGPGRIELWVLGFDLPHNRPRAGRIRSWVLHNGGIFFDFREINALAASLKAPLRAAFPAAAAPALPPALPAAAARAGSARRRPAWLLAAAFLGGLIALGAGYARNRRIGRLRAARAAAGKPLQLVVIFPDGGRRRLEITEFPLALAAAAGDVRLTSVDDDKDCLHFEERRGALYCLSPRGPALMDGVARRSLRLREGACLRQGPLRIDVDALPVPPRPASPPPRPLFLVWLVPLALLLLAAFFLPGKTAPGSRPPAGEAGQAKRSVAAAEAVMQTAAGPPQSGVAAAPGGAAAPSWNTAWTVPPLLPGEAGGAEPSASRPALRQIAPNQQPAFFAADILCFHAHPDDESLDFGVLLARAAAENLRTVVVLFTDGEGGNDAYPARACGGTYPRRKLSGPDLAALRIDESTRALSRLGVEQYVRLGLKNHAYNRSDQALSVAATVAAWGGEEALERRLRALLAGFRPRLVAAPAAAAAPGSPGEHFEHLAVGYLVERALRGDPGEAVYLTALDPGFWPPDLRRLDIDAELCPPGWGVSYRDRQLLALAEYRSQYDAAVAGATRLPEFDAESYRLEPGPGARKALTRLLPGWEGYEHAPH
jgi:LmbE family N-acetylglucosaminyl deacetylase